MSEISAGNSHDDLTLGDLYLRDGLFEKAEFHLNKAISAGQANSRTFYLKAKLLAQKNRRATARNCLLKALQLDPADTEARRFLMLLDSYPGWRPRIGNPGQFIRGAEKSYENGKLPAMMSDVLNMAAAIGPEPNAQLFKAYCMLGNYASACSTLASLTAPGPGRRRLDLLELSTPWHLTGKLPPAYYSWHARALKLAKPGPGMKMFMLFLAYTLAICYSAPGPGFIRKFRAQGKKDRDKAAFTKIITARQSLWMGDWRKAAADYTAMLKAGYKNWYILCSLGEILICCGDPCKGFNSFRLAREGAVEEDLGEILAWEGELRLFLKQYGRAAALLKKSGSRLAPCWLGAAHLELGETQRAIVQLKKAAVLCPGDTEGALWLAEAYRRKGRYAQALVGFESAEKTDKGNFWALLGKAMTFADTGQTKEMTRCFRLAAKTWPAPLKAAGGTHKTSQDDMPEIMRRTAALCGGFRRTEKHLFQLVLAAGTKTKYA